MIKIYPTEIEAVDDTDDLVFKLRTFDEFSATLEVTALISLNTIDEFCNALRRAIALLELETTTHECDATPQG